MTSKLFFQYFLRVQATFLLIFFISRVVFLLWFTDQIPSGAGAELPGIFLGGFLIDLMAVSLIGGLCFLLSRLLFFTSDMLRMRFFNLLSRFSFFLTSLVLISDIFYYRQFGVRLNVMAMNITEDPGPIFQTILESFPVIPALLISTVLTLLFFLISRNWSILITRKEKPGRGWSALILLVSALGSLLYLPEPFWTYLPSSSSGMLNQTMLNGYYSFFRSVQDQGLGVSDIPEFRSTDEATALRITGAMLGTAPESSSSTKSPFLRITQGPPDTMIKPHIVIIILESFGSNLAGKSVQGIPLTPKFNTWTSRGMYFSDFYANGPRTHHGVVSTISGFPSVLGGNLARRKGTRVFHTLADMLRDRNYHSVYWHNGNAGYDDLDLIIRQSFDEIRDRSDLGKVSFENNWGACDQDLYREVLREFQKHDSTPTLTVLMTVSNHLPYDIPPAFRYGHPELKQLTPMEQGMLYADRALGDFLDSCSKLPRHRNTYYFILGDHAEMYKPSDSDLGIFHIPLLILGPGISPGVSDKTASQADLASTILDLVPGTGYNHSIGHSVLDSLHNGFAFCKGYANDVMYKSGEILARYNFNTRELLFFNANPDRSLGSPVGNPKVDREKVREQIQAYMQAASFVFRNGKYRIR